MLNAYRVEHNT